MSTDLIPTAEPLTGIEYTTCLLSFRESEAEPESLFRRAAIAQAIHDASENQMNIYGAAGWTLACLQPLAYKRRTGVGRYRAVWMRDHRVPSGRS